MSSIIESKAPGKILWLGGYAILERPNIGLVTATDNAYVSAQIILLDNNEVHLSALDLNEKYDGVINPDTGKIEPDPLQVLNLLKTSCEIASMYALSKGKKISGFKINTKNDEQFAYALDSGKLSKSGLGASAAVTVATVKGILAAYGVNSMENEAAHKLSQLAHSVATGKVGSGFDIAAATYGSIVYTRYSSEILKNFPKEYSYSDIKEIAERPWDYKIDPISLPKNFKIIMANFIGQAAITVSLVGKVSEFKAKNPDEYKRLITKINEQDELAIFYLRKLAKESGDQDAVAKFREAFDSARSFTKELGISAGVEIEDDEATRLIEECKEHGALVARLPGAGGRDSIAAIALDGKSYSELKEFLSCKKELKLLEVAKPY
ncbi:MAG: hypothetical protein M1331_02390 [Candidatus Marsarchaeota archaeon]|nr:hypothetical protein [Candidatus Marsarchaeota archaeon]MCL5106218.1 hypothetical protein [Candidatus Marsarchaeota archaeon]